MTSAIQPIFTSSARTAVDPKWLAFLVLAGVPSPGVDVENGIYSTSYDATHFWGATFSSEKNLSAFGQAKAVLDKSSDGLLMSLVSIPPTPPQKPTDSPVPKVISFPDALATFGVLREQQGHFLKSVLAAVADSTAVNIDYSKRNGIWMLPGECPQVSTIMSFTLDPNGILSSSSISSALNTEFGLNLQDLTIPLDKFSITLQKDTLGVPDATVASGFNIVSVSKFAISIPVEGFLFSIQYSVDGVQLSLTDASTEPLWDRISKLGGDAPSETIAAPAWNNVLDNIHLWNITIGGLSEGTTWWKLSFVVDLTLSNNTKTPLALAYDSRTATFTGALLFSSMFPSLDDKLMPSYDHLADLPPTASQPPSSLKLSDMFGITLPQEVPSELIEGFVSFSKASAGQQSSLSFSMHIIKSSDVKALQKTVPAPFDWNQIYVAVTKSNTLSFDVYSSFSLNPTNPIKFAPALLSVELSRVSSTWELKGQASNLQFGALTDFLDPDHSNAILSVLGKLSIKAIDVDYTYSSGIASSFLFSGTIDFGQLQLKLFYQYASISAGADTAAQRAKNKDPNSKLVPVAPTSAEAITWSFDAFLGASVTGATIGSVLDSIIDDASSTLPDFVGKIDVAPQAGDASPVVMKIVKSSVSGQRKTVFTLKVIVSLVEFTFVQIAGNEPTDVPKTLLRVSVDKIPLIDKLPVVNELPQPFEKLEYLWVRGNSPMSKGEVDAINTELGESDKLYYKITTSKPTDDTPAIAPGHHFIVIERGQTVLDHVFNNAKSKPAPKPGDPAPSAEIAAANDPALVPPPSKTTLQKQTKFLTISSISLQYKDGILWLMLDATLTIGPLSMSLIGFGVGLAMSRIKLNDVAGIVQHFVEDHLFQLHGLAVDFERPPLLIAGVFEHEISVVGDLTQDSYRGGIAVSFPPYTFVAVGEYAVVKQAGIEYKSVFIFAKLDGPLITFEFATITGVRMGFGLNSIIRSPDVNELTAFPFINDSGVAGAGNNPMKILQAFRGGDKPWVNVKKDSYWFAAGFTVTAFDLLSITAVAVLGFADNGVDISIYADAVAKMPPNVKDNDMLLIYVELAMVADLNFIDHYFRVEASLAPTSFILSKDCHIYGGFALCYWFGSNPHAGDWVFTIGGYHKSFDVPSHYPNPKRLGIAYKIGDCLHVIGEAYFAITPSCLMAGGVIHFMYNLGIISAYLNATLDCLINFHPLHYQAEMHVDVGVACDIDILFITVHIAVSIGCTLDIQGPEFGGTLYVDFWVMGFSIDFGAPKQLPDPLHLSASNTKDNSDGFYELVHKAGPPGGTPPATDTTASNKIVHLKFALEDGAFPMPTKDATTGDPANAGAGAKWYVKGGSFRFRISCDFAVSSVRLVTDMDAQGKLGGDPLQHETAHTEVPVVAGLAPICSIPMRIHTNPPPKPNISAVSPITSPLTIAIMDTERHDVSTGWTADYIVKPVPSALWASYDARKDPLSSSYVGALPSSSDSTVQLAMGVTLSAPLPVLAESKIGAFDAVKMSKEEVQTKDSTPWILASAEPTQNSFLPAVLNAGIESLPGPQRWALTQGAWSSIASASALAADMALLCTKALGWDQLTPEEQAKTQSVTPKPWALNSAMPSRLVSGTKNKAGRVVGDGLDNMYLALPRFTTSKA